MDGPQKTEVILAMLPDSARSLIKLQEHSPLPFAMVSREGVFISSNDGFCSMLGYGKDEIVMKYWQNITPPEWYNRLTENWIKLTVGQVPHFETEFLRKDGSRVCADVFPNRITDDRGNPLCYYAFVEDITDRKKIENDLRQSEERYRLLAETGEDFIYIIDRDLRVTFLNKAGSASVGRAPGEVIGLHLSEIFPGETYMHFNRNLLKVFDSGQPVSDMHRFGFPGKMFWLHVKLTPIRDEKGNVTHVIGISRDITEMKRAEETLRASERKLSQAQRIAHIGSWEWDLRTGNISCSEEAFRIFGTLPRASPVNFREVIQSIYPEDMKGLKEMIETGEAMAKPSSMDLRIIRKDGELRHVQIISEQIVRDDSGDPVRMFGTLQDITERKQIEIALRLDEVRLETLLELNEMGDAPVKDMIDFALEKSISLTQSKIGYIGTVSEDGKFMMVMSYSRHAMERCSIQENPLVFPLDKGGLWAESITRREPVIIDDYDAPHPLKKGIPPGHVKIKRLISVPVIDNGRVIGQYMLGGKETPYDQSDIRQLNLLLSGLWRIIHRKNAENALLDSKSRAELYVDLMGHDINNMNQIALGYLEMACEVLAPGDREKEFLNKPIEVLNRSSRLIRNVRKLQIISTGEMKTGIIDLGPVIREIINQYSKVPGKMVVINSQPFTGVRVMANPLLTDLFSNLIDNAIKHSDENRVEIDLNVSSAFHGSGWYYRVCVEDNGPGIADGLKKSIFDGHHRGATTTKGSGIGLRLVRTLVESYGGHIWIEDRVSGEPVKGSRFVVMLPMIKESRDKKI